MKPPFAIALGLALCSTRVLGGDGLPAPQTFDETSYVILKVSAKQLEQIEKDRRVVLTKDQLKRLRSLAEGFPKRIGVASPFVENISDSRFAIWPDQITAVWYQKNMMAIPRDSLTGSDRCREFSRDLNDGDALLIDTSGHFSIGSKPIDVDELKERLTKLAGKEPDGKNFEIFILRPPTLDNPNEEALIQGTIEQISHLCEAVGIDYQIGG